MVNGVAVVNLPRWDEQLVRTSVMKVVNFELVTTICGEGKDECDSSDNS